MVWHSSWWTIFAFTGSRATRPLINRASPAFARTAAPVLRYVSIAYDPLVNSINWQPKALRQLRKIEAQAVRQIRAAVTSELADLSKARNVKALTNHEYGYRLRVGGYRVLFEFDGSVSIVSIEEVRRRDERTY